MTNFKSEFLERRARVWDDLSGRLRELKGRDREIAFRILGASSATFTPLSGYIGSLEGCPGSFLRLVGCYGNEGDTTSHPIARMKFTTDLFEYIDTPKGLSIVWARSDFESEDGYQLCERNDHSSEPDDFRHFPKAYIHFYPQAGERLTRESLSELLCWYEEERREMIAWMELQGKLSPGVRESLSSVDIEEVLTICREEAEEADRMNREDELWLSFSKSILGDISHVPCRGHQDKM